MRTSAELRERFLSFFEEKGHVRYPSASIIPPADDPTTLFIVAGMQPMKRWFLGAEKPVAPRVTTAQKAVRAGGKQNDLDDVGLTNRHLCFLEMLGNFSFGDYFKDGAIDYAWEFITDHMNLERAAMLLQDVDSLFDIDTFRPLIDWLRERANQEYGSSEEATKAYRVIVEHARTAAFLVAAGIAPSNEGRGYVLRRVIRRAAQFGRRLGLVEPFLWQLAGIVREQMSSDYPELEERQREIQELIRGEEERFVETVERGQKLFEEIVAKGAITGEEAFRLYDTYGFPLELTKELAGERGLEVNEEEFTRLMEEQRERSRRGAAFDVDIRISPSAPRTEFVGYERTDVLTAILAYEDVGDGTFQAKLEESPFYPEGGGQVSDTGYIEDEETGARAELIKATRLDNDQVLTFQGTGFSEGMRVRAVVPWSVRFPTMANHTATHLLHKALRELLGEHVKQAGSAVRPDRLRFDFTHPQALTAEERERVEQAVNEIVFQNRPVRAFVTPIEEARKLGAMMLFGEKYGDEVRVIEIPGYSTELCGGTHVRWTAEIGPFVILSESSVGSGARRIEAVTSGEAYAYLHGGLREAEELRAELERVRKEARKPKAVAADDFT